MAVAYGVGLLYLISKSIQIDCGYCILGGQNAIPLNTCYNQSSLNGVYHSYEYQCVPSSSNAIFKVNYASSNCNDNDPQPFYSITITDITQQSCISMTSTPCLSNEYAMISKVNEITGEQEDKGIIINKCVSYSTPTADLSRYIQCNQEQQLQTWIFNDLSCTQLQDVVTHSLGDSYEEPDAILQSVQCPYCDLSSLSYNYNMLHGQPNINIDYVMLQDQSYAFPQPIHICNALDNSNSSYKYECIRNTVYKATWNHVDDCSGLYDSIAPLTNVMDANCLNYRTNTWHHSESIQPSYVTLTRYTQQGEARDISYITNYCIRQNHQTYIIIECQKDLMAIHY
eukprot:304953_1